MVQKISSVETRFEGGKKHTFRTDEEKKRMVDLISESGCKNKEMKEKFGIYPSEFYTWRVKIYGSKKKPHKPTNVFKSSGKRKSTVEEKMEWVRKIYEDGCGVEEMYNKFGIYKSTYYNWKNRHFPNGVVKTTQKIEVTPEVVEKVGIPTDSFPYRTMINREEFNSFVDDNKEYFIKRQKEVQELYDNWKKNDTISQLRSKISGEILGELTNKFGLTRGEIVSFLDRKTDLPFTVVNKICKHLSVTIV